MKIALNARLLIENKMTGMGVFTYETFRRIAASHLEHTFYFIFDRPYSENFITSENIIPIVVKPKVKHHPFFLHYWYEYALPKQLKKIQADLFISPDGFMSLKTSVPSLIVIHDINFEHYPHFLPRAISQYYRTFTPKYAKKAKHILTVSEFSKQDIQTQYGITPNKIDVVYNGANNIYKPIDTATQIEYRKAHTESCPFFLFVGILHQRKNIVNQLKAFDLFRKNNINSKHKFYIVGEKWKWSNEAETTFQQLEFKHDVIFAGRLSSEQLGFAIGSAEALMYVSFFEGFGIPILEAFYAGTPVITSTTTSMPEVAGNAALYANPNNIDEIAKAMSKIVFDKQIRDSLIAEGNIRKNLFTWEKTAESMWKAIEQNIL
jgi:glycosyltransferase involved in cell wall biosynthesis